MVLSSHSYRKFLICIENVITEAGTLNYYVLPRSIIGPLFFLLYINDLPPQFPEDLVTFTEEILNGKIDFLYS